MVIAVLQQESHQEEKDNNENNPAENPHGNILPMVWRRNIF
jgi:hypothetical protein